MHKLENLKKEFWEKLKDNLTYDMDSYHAIHADYYKEDELDELACKQTKSIPVFKLRMDLEDLIRNCQCL